MLLRVLRLRLGGRWRGVRCARRTTRPRHLAAFCPQAAAAAFTLGRGSRVENRERYRGWFGFALPV